MYHFAASFMPIILICNIRNFFLFSKLASSEKCIQDMVVCRIQNFHDKYSIYFKYDKITHREK